MLIQSLPTIRTKGIIERRSFPPVAIRAFPTSRNGRANPRRAPAKSATRAGIGIGIGVAIGSASEFEFGPTERFNRMITGFDPGASLPISAAAQAAYARSPIPELDASKFIVKGGSLYAGAASADRKIWRNELMWLPRFSAAYQLNSKTVIQGGYGLFYDTLNVLNQSPDQTGYSRATSTTLTTDFGVNWLAGNPRAGISPVADPFPVRSDGTRFDLPTGNALGLMARAGRGFNFIEFQAQHPRQQRWRIGLQRQLTASMVIDVAYSAMRVAHIPVSLNLGPLPEQYWASGNVRNDAIASNMNLNVTNPFRITNFSSLQTSDALQYWNMGTLSFFTSSTIRKNQLLRAFPQMNSLARTNAPLGRSKSDTLEITLQRRFSRGFSMNMGATWTRAKVANSFFDEFDPLPSWQLSNDSRPHRLVATGIYQLPFGKGKAYAQSGLLNHRPGNWETNTRIPPSVPARICPTGQHLEAADQRSAAVGQPTGMEEATAGRAAVLGSGFWVLGVRAAGAPKQGPNTQHPGPRTRLLPDFAGTLPASTRSLTMPRPNVIVPRQKGWHR